jgi:large subunit ribosomal protein L10
MPKITKEQKVKTVADLKDKLSRASGMVLANYHGLSVSQMQELKKSLKESDAEFVISKNTLITRAAKEAKKEIPSEQLEGPTAILFAFGDALASIKKLADFIKQYQLPEIKIGDIENRMLTKDEVLALAKIPSQQELYAKVVGSLNSPIYGLVATLSGNLRNLVYVLKQVEQSKGGATN